MAIEDEKWTRLLAKLIVDTQTGAIKWKGVAVEKLKPENPSNNLLFNLVASIETTYLCSVGEHAFRFDVLFQSPFSKTVPYSLNISDLSGRVLKRVPIQAGLDSLSRAITDQISGVDEFLDKYLSGSSST
jgi:hypothetical protein